MVKFIETGGRRAAARAEGGGMGTCLLGGEFQFHHMKRVLDTDGGDGYPTMRNYLRMVKKTHFIFKRAVRNKFFIFIYLFFLLFRAAYGSSQTRSPIGAAAAALHHSHSNAGSELYLRPTP